MKNIINKLSINKIKSIKVFSMVFILALGIILGNFAAKASNTSFNNKVAKKHSITEIVTKVNNCKLQANGEYLVSCVTENDEVIQAYNLNSYSFETSY